ncbi:MAG: hypothetical protein CO150_07790 [Nitrospirae bacterium CG_4_9_14_3_um_filter_53_35]|nr:MAG: hypothetical protein AUK29_09245 [Nitrospirae bacterium CG2_30_53_67]PIV85191.1 MAG: hypothetical protein COW52_03645 [Nitrospirae bacterium CG17_big_fil_post_rev_8_21_14_2_50_50_9]PIW84541.1 MAG: hypothetical protein COZ95_09290 [Nitrospirae bacterium CG_4_8_14_3_um_filter_50_41]PIX86310.1 MAG: hypothetical protein COZ32_03975 [Nitrospirae bacterium CG_4_10_14_3_um_filter_53_41]PJA73580.1 MAG: hypothetical protein CO150_07790 [Nitrospirae bacterium CG_4_9_14_3_um_filter_53_35]
MTDDVISGKKVWEKYDCIGCHTLVGEGAYYAPELKDIYSQKGPDFIRAFLKDPVKVWYGGIEKAKGQRKMPNLHLSDEEISHLIAFFEWIDKIDTHNWPPRPAKAVEAEAAEPGMTASKPVQKTAADHEVEEGRRLVTEKGCTSCHKIKGVGQTVGPDLTGVTKRLDPDTLHKRLKDPKSVNPESIMPIFGFKDEEIQAITAYLKTL